MKSKFLSKKLLIWLLAVMLIIASMTACGGKDDDDEDKDSKSRKEQSSDDDEDDDDEDEDDDKKKKDDDDVEATPEPTAEPTPEPTAEPTPEPTPEPTEEPAVAVDWETAYEDYFETCGPLVRENVVVLVSGEENGIYMEMAYGYSGKYSAFSMEIDGDYFEIITDPDRVYFYSESGDEYNYAQALREDDSETDILGMAESMEEMVTDIEYDCYLMETEESGTVYDVVACYVDYSGEECEAYAYINRDTQNMELLEMEDSAGNYIDIEIIDPGKDGFMEMIDETIETYDGVDEVTFDEMGDMVFDFLFTMMSDVEVDVTEPDDSNIGVGIDGDDWSTAYDNFFDNGLTIPEAFEITTSIDMDGIVLDYVVAQDKGVSMVRYRIGDYGVDAYTDGSMIVMENIGLNGSEWVCAEIESGDDVADILGADFTELMGGVTDSVSSATYVEAVEENGVVYDVLEIDSEGTPALAYIDREKQIVNRMIIEAEGLEMVCKFDGFTPFKVPAESANATGMTKDEIANYYAEAIVESVYASMGMEY